MVHGHEVERAERAVDVRDELAHLALEFGGVGECRGGDLDEDDFADIFRVVGEQAFEGAELCNGVSESEIR